MTEFLDGRGRVAARVGFDPPRVESDDPEVASWATAGAPSLRGEQHGDLMVELPTLVPATDRLWGLAVLNEAERRGWTTRVDRRARLFRAALGG